VEMLQNLINSVAQFSRDQPAPMMEVGARDQKWRAVFFVRDNGIGIESAHDEKIFGRFDKLVPHSDGTGMGLALAKRILEVHGGRL
jgi:signal transduction histidine kinase